MADVLVALGPPAGRGYLRVVGLTTRYRFEAVEGIERARAHGGPVIWAFWHNRLLGPLLPHRDRKAGVVISRSRDGELISRVVAGFGYVPLRGSSSRGGAAVLRSVLRHVKGGLDVAFTPDGPRGPRYRVQPGAAYAAHRAGVPVIPVGVGMSRRVVFRSWDRFQLPLPFGVIQLVYGAPLLLEDAGEGARLLEAALSAATERADRLLGVTSP